MDGEALLRKLQVKPGARLWVVGAPMEVEAALRQVATLVGPDQPRDAALAFCHGPEEVVRLAPLALKGLAEDGPLWFAWRKGASVKQTGLSRDAGWAPLDDLGYRGVRAIAFDETWSGKRFREVWRVKAQ
jgi:hypothetical protein